MTVVLQRVDWEGVQDTWGRGRRRRGGRGGEVAGVQKEGKVAEAGTEISEIEK